MVVLLRGSLRWTEQPIHPTRSNRLWAMPNCLIWWNSENCFQCDFLSLLPAFPPLSCCCCRSVSSSAVERQSIIDWDELSLSFKNHRNDLICLQSTIYLRLFPPPHRQFLSWSVCHFPCRESFFLLRKKIIIWVWINFSAIIIVSRTRTVVQ